MRRSFRNAYLSTFIVWCALTLLSGCSEEEEPAVASGSTAAADNALKEAEARLEASGMPLSIDEPGDLTHPGDLIPDPADLGDAEKRANFEEAIAQLNIALAELEQQVETGTLGSVSDRALLHLHLGFTYCFDAIARLLLSDDPEETFIIERDSDNPDNLWYTIGVAPDVQAELDATEDPLERPLVFTVEERQAIIDAADLIEDAVVKPKAPNIQPQFSSVNRHPYTESAVWHFERAAVLFGQYSPEIMESLEMLNEELEKMRAMLQKKTEEWGFIYTPPVD